MPSISLGESLQDGCQHLHVASVLQPAHCFLLMLVVYLQQCLIHEKNVSKLTQIIMPECGKLTEMSMKNEVAGLHKSAWVLRKTCGEDYAIHDGSPI